MFPGAVTAAAAEEQLDSSSTLIFSIAALGIGTHSAWQRGEEVLPKNRTCFAWHALFVLSPLHPLMLLPRNILACSAPSHDKKLKRQAHEHQRRGRG